MRSLRPLNAVVTRIASIDSKGCMKVGELMRLLEEDGWHVVRTRGSHRQYKNANKPGTVTVAGKPSLDVPPGTLNAILKQAGLKKAGSGG